MNPVRSILILLMAVCALFLSSCSRDNGDVYDPDYVLRFDPAIGISTRTDGQEGAVYPRDGRFRVWTYLLDGQRKWTEHAREAKAWLSGEEIAWNDNAWTTQDRLHWKSKEERLTVFACSPSSLDARFDIHNGIQVDGFDTRRDTTDILYTDAITDQDKVLLQGVVPVSFRHALTGLEVHMVSGMQEDVTFLVKSVRISDVSCKGDFSSLYGTWLLSVDQTADLELCAHGPVMVDVRDTFIGFQRVLPQVGRHDVTIKYDLYQSGRLILEDLIVKASPIKTPWKIGKRYVYTIRITAYGVTYNTDILD